MRNPALRFSRLLAVSTALAAASVSASAHASLTQAESTQVHEYYVGAKPNDAGSVRALVARPDLSADESAAALSAAIGSVAFTPQRSAFLHALVFAGASLPSRSVLALATTRGVLGRVNEILAKFAGDFDAHADAVAEVTRLLVFLDQEIASSGPQRGVGAPPESGIAPSAYDDCAKAIADTMALHPKWLKADAKLSPVATKVRAQAELSLVDMMNDSPTYRVDVADRLALTGARRTFFLQSGVLLLDDSKAADDQVEAVRAFFQRLPAARAGVVAIFFGDDKSSLVGGGSRKKEVVSVKSGLASVPAVGPLNSLLSDDIAQGFAPAAAGRVSSALTDLARELAAVTVRRALENRGDLALQATRDARAAIDKKVVLGNAFPVAGPPPEPSAVLAQAVELVALDAQPTFAAALGHFRASQKEPIALFSDAVGILAVYAPPQAVSGLSLALGHSKPDGASETVIATNVRLAPSGAATALTLGGSNLEIARDASGEVTLAKSSPAPTAAIAKASPAPRKKPTSDKEQSGH